MAPQDPRLALHAIDIIAELGVSHRELAGAEPTDVLRAAGNRVVLRGMLAGREVIFRLFMGKAGAAKAARLWGELQRIWPHMSQGPNRVNPPITAVPSEGLLVTGHCPGEGAAGLLANGAGPELSERAAGWLAAYAEPSLRRSRPVPAVWLERAARAAARQPQEALRPLEKRILQVLAGHAARGIQGRWQTAVTHGDYHAGNLIVDGDVLWGIDIGGPARLPLYRDAARFLCHMARAGHAGARHFGVDRDAFGAFARGLDLDEDERRSALPFFIGLDCLLRVEPKRLPKARLDHAIALEQGFLDDAARLWDEA